ncbi:MAG: hypothetical protein V4726_06825 [Verrucomicrobiota bacterium]
MKKLPSILCLAGTAVVLSNCAGLPGESPEHMRERVARQDKRFDARQEKRQIRSETADRRYDTWWNNATGHKDTDW